MQDMTLINVILDRSGSMSGNAIETVGMFNKFLEDQKQEKDYAELSLIQFDNEYEENYIRKPIKECVPLVLGKTYQPRGMTALLDAIGKSITTVGSILNDTPDRDRPKRVLFIIITDGHENVSKEFDNKTVNKMIDTQKLEYNWDFIFLASGINAFNEASKFGMGRGKTASFSSGAGGQSAIGNTMSAYATTYRSTGDTDLDVKDFKGE
jgi:uncharacterized protein YegL